MQVIGGQSYSSRHLRCHMVTLVRNNSHEAIGLFLESRRVTRAFMRQRVVLYIFDFLTVKFNYGLRTVVIGTKNSMISTVREVPFVIAFRLVIRELDVGGGVHMQENPIPLVTTSKVTHVFHSRFRIEGEAWRTRR
jgi:hypothetical protein